MRVGIEGRLRTLAASGTLVEVYTNPDKTEEFWVGNIAAVDENWVLLAQYDEDGARDGYGVRRIEDILAVAEDTRYLRKIAALHAGQTDGGARMEDGKDDVLERLLDYAIAKGYIVSVEIARSGVCDVSGLVRGCDADVIDMEQFDDYGAANGVIHLARESVTRVDCNSASARRIGRLLVAGRGN